MRKPFHIFLIVFCDRVCLLVRHSPCSNGINFCIYIRIQSWWSVFAAEPQHGESGGDGARSGHVGSQHDRPNDVYARHHLFSLGFPGEAPPFVLCCFISTRGFLNSHPAAHDAIGHDLLIRTKETN